MVLQLLGFHLMILCKGVTTYDYIIVEQKRQRQRAVKTTLNANGSNYANRTNNTLVATPSAVTSRHASFSPHLKSLTSLEMSKQFTQKASDVSAIASNGHSNDDNGIRIARVDSNDTKVNNDVDFQ